MAKITSGDWDEWKDSKATEHFFKFLQREANSLRQAAGVGAFISDSILETGQNYVNAIRKAEVYDLIGSVEFLDTIEETDSADSTSRTQSSD